MRKIELTDIWDGKLFSKISDKYVEVKCIQNSHTTHKLLLCKFVWWVKTILTFTIHVALVTTKVFSSISGIFIKGIFSFSSSLCLKSRGFSCLSASVIDTLFWSTCEISRDATNRAFGNGISLSDVSETHFSSISTAGFLYSFI